MSRIFDELFAMIDAYSHVLVVRFDLHMPFFTYDNKMLSQFLNLMRRYVLSEYGCELGYIWVREQHKAHQQHYHLALFLNGHKINHPSKLLTIIEKIWIDIANKKPFTPKMCYYNVYRKAPKTIAAAISRLSYLSKEETKDYSKRLSRSYGASKHAGKRPKR